MFGLPGIATLILPDLESLEEKKPEKGFELDRELGVSGGVGPAAAAAGGAADGPQAASGGAEKSFWLDLRPLFGRLALCELLSMMNTHLA